MADWLVPKDRRPCMALWNGNVFVYRKAHSTWLRLWYDSRNGGRRVHRLVSIGGLYHEPDKGFIGTTQSHALWRSRGVSPPASSTLPVDASHNHDVVVSHRIFYHFVFAALLRLHDNMIPACARSHLQATRQYAWLKNSRDANHMRPDWTAFMQWLAGFHAKEKYCRAADLIKMGANMDRFVGIGIGSLVADLGSRIE